MKNREQHFKALGKLTNAAEKHTALAEALAYETDPEERLYLLLKLWWIFNNGKKQLEDALLPQTEELLTESKG